MAKKMEDMGMMPHWHCQHALWKGVGMLIAAAIFWSVADWKMALAYTLGVLGVLSVLKGLWVHSKGW